MKCLESHDLFIVSTQFLENYACHEADGKFDSGNYYWKYKSGSDYLVSGFEREQDAMAYIAHTECKVDDYGIESVVGVKTAHEWSADLLAGDSSDDYKQFLVDCLKERDFKIR